MRVLVAPQELKGTLTAVEAASAIEAGVRLVAPDAEIDLLPIADGGPGTTRALLEAMGGEACTATAMDPLMRPVEATWGLLASGEAIVECAAASGLLRLTPAELDPRRASSFGTGQLIAAALAAGARRIIVGLGGSATNDGGAGMAQALGFRLLDALGEDLPPGGAALARLDRIETGDALPAIRETEFIAATDVTNPLCGPDGASAVYGPQKGADEAAVSELDAALRRFAAVVERDLGVPVLEVPGAGAAGGLGAGCIAFLGATTRSGAAVVAEAADLAGRAKLADVVVTAEGRLDGQSAFGKATFYVAGIAKAAGKPVVCLPGSLGLGHEAATAAFTLVEPLAGGLERPAAALSEAAARALVRLHSAPS